MGGRSLHTHTLPPHVSLSYPHETRLEVPVPPKLHWQLVPAFIPMAAGPGVFGGHCHRHCCCASDASSLCLVWLQLCFSNSPAKGIWIMPPFHVPDKRLVLGIVSEQFNVLSDQSVASDSATLPCPIPGGRGS